MQRHKPKPQSYVPTPGQKPRIESIHADSEFSSPLQLSPQGILQLQRMIGNRAVHSLFARTPAQPRHIQLVAPGNRLMRQGSTRENAIKELPSEQRTIAFELKSLKEKSDGKKKSTNTKGLSKKKLKKLESFVDDVETALENVMDDNMLTVMEKAGFSTNTFLTRRQLMERFPNGPLFNEAEMAAIKMLSKQGELGRWWLSAVGMFSLEQARAYLEMHKFHTWLMQEPANRLLLATVAWTEGYGKGETNPHPAYTLGRHMAIQTGQMNDNEQEVVEAERDKDIREAFVNTMVETELTDVAEAAIEEGGVRSPTYPGPKLKGPAKDVDTVVKENLQAINILKKVFLLLQSGLQVYDRGEGTHIDFMEGDVARALAHGGRVHIIIPALISGGTAHDLTDWLGLTKDGKPVGGAVFKRDFGTHHTKRRLNDEGQTDIIEEGEKGASIRNLFEKGGQLWGMNVSGGGFGKIDFNGDVILPDGAHGHMFVGFLPPTMDMDGNLQIGMETTAPGAPSMVGYQHTSESSEATANPESSFYGHKSAKIGQGKVREVTLTKKPVSFKRHGKKIKIKRVGVTKAKGEVTSPESTRARQVDLNRLNNSGDGWLNYLNNLNHWFENMEQAAKDKEELKDLYRKLVGSRGEFSRFREENSEMDVRLEV